MPSRVTHFEIYGVEPAKLAAFYEELFGWRIERAQGMDYWRIHLDPSDSSNAGGGITYRPTLDPRGWMQFVNVESIDDSISVAERGGAKVLRSKTAVPPEPLGTRCLPIPREMYLLYGNPTRQRFRLPSRIKVR
jgi:predicted enzyme related to lactoylglutathione lyase